MHPYPEDSVMKSMTVLVNHLAMAEIAPKRRRYQEAKGCA